MQARQARSLDAHRRPGGPFDGPDGPDGVDGPDRRPPGRSTAFVVVGVLAVVLVFVVALLPSPYAIEAPGPVYDTLGSSGTGKARAPLISIPDRRTYPTSGRLDLLTVSVRASTTGGPSWFELAEAWLDPSDAVIPLEAVFPQGETEREADEESTAEMTGSQRSATTAALTRLGYDVRSTVTIGAVREGTAASGTLRTGDVVRSFAGRTLPDACSLQNAVLANGTKRATVVIDRDGTTRTLSVTPRAAPDGRGGTRPLLGVVTSATTTYPFTVDLRIDAVGGPSAGMMFALGIIDKLTPGSLTGGRHVAGTGTICGDGTVGAIGGIVQKMAAARAAGVTLFLAPASNCNEVAGHIPSGLDVVAVGTLSDSVEALETARDQGSVTGLPTCSAPLGSAG